MSEKHRFHGRHNMRYRVVIRTDAGEAVELSEATLDRAIGFARRLNEPGEWFEIVDAYTGNVVASSESERQDRK